MTEGKDCDSFNIRKTMSELWVIKLETLRKKSTLKRTCWVAIVIKRCSTLGREAIEKAHGLISFPKSAQSSEKHQTKPVIVCHEYVCLFCRLTRYRRLSGDILAKLKARIKIVKAFVLFHC
jgi:hypothetical protein